MENNIKNGLEDFSKRPNREVLEKQQEIYNDIDIHKAIDELLKGEWLLENNGKILQTSIKNGTETYVDKENIEKLIIAETKRLLRKEKVVDLGSIESDKLDEKFPDEIVLKELKGRIGNLVDLFQMPENYINKGY